MNAAEILLSCRWVLREKDPELYYQVKDEIGSYRRWLEEKFGYSVLITPQLIKLEKIPGLAEPWMGIQDFEDPEDYVMLCQLLMYLESREKEEQFILSMVTEFIQSHPLTEPVDWTSYTQRRRLIRVLRYALKQQLMKLTDGNEELFLRDQQTELLFENTGISRYFLRGFSRDLMDYSSPQEFMESDWIDQDEDRGIIRRHRVYRRLLMSPGIYRNAGQDEDFIYLRNQRNSVEQDFRNVFQCDLHLHRSSAYLILDEDCTMGKTFPANNAVSDLICILGKELRQRIKVHQAHYELSEQETLTLSEDSLQRLLKKIIQERLKHLPKAFQLESADNKLQEVMDKLISIGAAERVEAGIQLKPLLGKLAGDYPQKEE